MPRALDVTGLALVGLAHVDHLEGRVLGEPRGDPLGIDVGPPGLIGGVHVDEGSAPEPGKTG